MQNRFAFDLTPDEREAILDAVATIQRNLPFLIDLSPGERQELFKAGPKSRTFLELALTTAQQHPDVLPRSFDTENFAQDVALFEALERPYVALRDLLRQVEDTRIAVGAEAMEQARAVYHYIQGHPGSGQLNDAYEALRYRFRAQGRRRRGGTPPQEPTP